MNWNPHPWLPGVHPSPNLHDAPEVYETGLLALDPEQRVERRIQSICDWKGLKVLDLGAGNGFYIARFAETAQHVFAVEPHAPSRCRAIKRVGALELENVSVGAGSSERIYLPDHAVEFAFARYAYFWGPGSEAGLKEIERVLQPGGHFFVIDHDRRKGQFASWLNRLPHYPKGHDLVMNFWRNQGFTHEQVMSEWRFRNREDLEAVVRNELPGELAEEVIGEHEGLQIEMGFSIYWRQY